MIRNNHVIIISIIISRYVLSTNRQNSHTAAILE